MNKMKLKSSVRYQEVNNATFVSGQFYIPGNGYKPPLLTVVVTQDGWQHVEIEDWAKLSRV